MQKILVIEADPTVRKALKRLFESHGYMVDLADDGSSGLESFRNHWPSAVILDLRLPDMSGRDICREIIRLSPETPVIVLTANSDVFEKVVLLETGARDYVTKPFSPRELLARLRAALRTVKPQNVTETLIIDDVNVNLSTREVSRYGISILLTKKECAALKFLIQNPERVVSRQELLNDIWDYKGELPTRTIDQHIHNLRTKLEKDPAHPIHFRTVFGGGYKFVP